MGPVSRGGFLKKVFMFNMIPDSFFEAVAVFVPLINKDRGKPGALSH